MSEQEPPSGTAGSSPSSAAAPPDDDLQWLLAGIADCAFFRLDTAGRVASWNLGAQRLKGYLATQIIGSHLSTFYTPEDRASGLPLRMLAAALAEGKHEAEGWRVRQDGSRFWASVLINVIRNSEGEITGFAKITRDMTERRAMQDQLNQSQKMEAIGQLTGGVAHDFNNLLTIILGNLDTLSRALPLDDERSRRALDHATQGAQRAATLTRQLLAFARRQPLNPQPTDVNQLVAQMSELARRTLNESVLIEARLGGGLGQVDVDAAQLQSALLNLAVNARDAMPTGGRLIIETSCSHIDATRAQRYGEVTAGDYVQISVSDTGSGMEPEVMARACDPFFTTKPTGKGTGLGLSQVFGFVKQSGGHLGLYSEPGRGTTIRIYLPKLTGRAQAQSTSALTPTPRGDASETILVVEDDAEVRAYSTDSLRELGFSVLEASGGEMALEVLEQHPEISMLFTDVGLPGINGRELVEAARQRRPSLPVLFTSGYARDVIVHQGRLDEGVELLSKPFSAAQLAVRIRQVLDSRLAS